MYISILCCIYHHSGKWFMDDRELKVVMGVPQTPTPSPHMYQQELQLKLYQAFIFSIPILFSIILFLLFYLFYLKRRASSLSSPPPHTLSRTPNTQTTYPYSSSSVNLKVQFLDKLPRILFDEDLRTRDSVCCVCLGEFEVKEELLQIPYCKHVFHIDCIHNWLQSKSTCPLCRCSIIPTTNLLNPPPPPPPIVSEPPQQGGISGSPSHIISLPHRLEDEAGASSNITIFQGNGVLIR
ncbi:probable E3 ubiquitin-protein ligase RHA4A isoform X2 [Gastrolobium bilobum]|uniref:probable E3 ubiquitin-protein ligase RHA4A isoform X2 n=1 Tax=Gastrolobium bilobum TaxID=150636 RepID=UPI002AAF4513|nr:probable E3 ubiquitin-protein ligase RHA4A isoform X2 [Gastrolobium bilobum]